MARPSLAELKNRFKESTKKKDTFGDNAYYPFWKMDFGAEAIVRILPDADEENPDVFKIEKYEHKIHVNNQEKRVSCLKNYGDECPICDRSYKYYKAEGDSSVKGKYYWKSKSTLIRVMVIQDPLPVDPEKGSWVGKVVTLSLTKEIMDRIVASMAEFDDKDEEGNDAPPPWDVNKGSNFVIRKGEKNVPGMGKLPSYIASGFARNSSPIPEKYRENIKLVNLSTLIPASPGIEHVVALLEAHDTGESYDKNKVEENKAKNTKPTNTVSKTESDTVNQTVKTTKTEVDERPPFDPDQNAKQVTQTSTTSSDDGDDDDIIARIRNRNKK